MPIVPIFPLRSTRVVHCHCRYFFTFDVVSPHLGFIAVVERNFRFFTIPVGQPAVKPFAPNDDTVRHIFLQNLSERFRGIIALFKRLPRSALSVLHKVVECCPKIPPALFGTIHGRPQPVQSIRKFAHNLLPNNCHGTPA